MAEYSAQGLLKTEVNGSDVVFDSLIQHQGKGQQSVACFMKAAFDDKTVNILVDGVKNKVTIPQGAIIQSVALIAAKPELINDKAEFFAGFAHPDITQPEAAAFLNSRVFGSQVITGAALKKYGFIAAPQILKGALATGFFQSLGIIEGDIAKDGVPAEAFVGEPLANMQPVIGYNGIPLAAGAVQLQICYIAC